MNWNRLKNPFSRRQILSAGGAVTLGAALEPLTKTLLGREIIPLNSNVPSPDRFDNQTRGVLEVLSGFLNNAQSRYLFVAGGISSAPGKNPHSAFLGTPQTRGLEPFTYLPGGLSYREQDKWMWEEGGNLLLNERMNRPEAKFFVAGSTGPVSGLWLEKQCELNPGLELACPEDSYDFVEALGFNPAPYAMSSFPTVHEFTADVRGFLCMTPTVDTRMKAPERFTGYYSSDWNAYASAAPVNFIFEIPQHLLKDLSAREAKSFELAVRQAGLAISNRAYANEEAQLVQMRSQNKIRFLEYPAAMKARAMDFSQTAIRESLGGGSASHAYLNLGSFARGTVVV